MRGFINTARSSYMMFSKRKREVTLGVYLGGKGSYHDLYVWKKLLSYLSTDELNFIKITIIYNEELYRDNAADGINDFKLSDVSTSTSN